jgi:hypothetical protein
VRLACEFVCEVRSLNRYLWFVVILLGLVVFSPAPGQSRAMSALHDFAHAPVFGAVCWFTLAWLRGHWLERRFSVGVQYAVAILIAIVLGLVTEAAQRLAGGDSSWLDLGADALGAMAFAALFAVFDRRVTSRPLKIGGAVLGIAALVWHTLPAVTMASLYQRRNANFPELFDASDHRPHAFMLPVNAEIHSSALPSDFARYPGEQATRILFARGTWPALQLLEPYADWRGYSSLAIDVTNPDEQAMQVTVRVQDEQHNNEHADRFNRSFQIPARTRTVIAIPLAAIRAAPKGRELDMSRIENVVIFSKRMRPPREIYVSRIWLQHDH